MDTLEAAVQAARGSDRKARRRAADALASWIDRREAQEALVELLGDEATTESARATLVRGGEACAPCLAGVLKRKMTDDRGRRRFEGAALALGDIGGDAAVDALVEAVKRDGPPEPLAAALGRTGSPKAAAALAGLFGKADGRTVAEGLLRLGDPGKRRLFDKLEDESPAVRHAALRAVGALPEAHEPILARLADEAIAVRTEAAEILGRRRDGRAETALVGALASDPAAGVRKAAAAALGEIADSRAADALSKGSRDADAGVRLAAVEALGRLGAAGVVALARCVRSGDRAVQDAAKRALQQAKGSADGRGRAALAVAEARFDDALREGAVAAEFLVDSLRDPHQSEAAVAAATRLLKTAAADVPVEVLRAFAEPGDVRQAIETGDGGFDDVPVDCRELVELARRAVEKRG